MKNEQFDELDEFIQQSVIHTNPLPAGFAEKVGNQILARHRNKENRWLYAIGLLYFCLALAGVFGLSLLIDERLAFNLLQTLIAYKAVFVFGMTVFVGYHFFDKRLVKKF
ncbi:hypothetical protein [Pedobacter nutrimenti]|uniref:hypothetical protein n=1 Tax=Pedobacter nutrimenti TaxID=1241337 RepID=UPI00292F1F65|nr:hypothetical protein [Pedobacter nutrimenti]